jgi:hypothetical protein
MQKLVDYLVAVENRDQRTRYAHVLVELMRQIHPNMKDNQDYSNKLWDDLYIMSGFRLDVDSPFPPPRLRARPNRSGASRGEWGTTPTTSGTGTTAATSN